MTHLLEFYGTDCPYCDKMHKLVQKLEKEENLQVERLEVWNNQKNEELFSELDCGLCGGVPFFYNTKTKKWICGEASYRELKSWALE